MGWWRGNRLVGGRRGDGSVVAGFGRFWARKCARKNEFGSVGNGVEEFKLSCGRWLWLEGAAAEAKEPPPKGYRRGPPTSLESPQTDVESPRFDPAIAPFRRGHEDSPRRHRDTDKHVEREVCLNPLICLTSSRQARCDCSRRVELLLIGWTDWWMIPRIGLVPLRVSPPENIYLTLSYHRSEYLSSQCLGSRKFAFWVHVVTRTCIQWMDLSGKTQTRAVVH